MPNWNYDESQYDPKDFALLPEGDYRVRIAEVTEKQSRTSGNDMFEITFDVSGVKSKLWFYIVFNPAEPEKTNQKLGKFFDCFGITDRAIGTGKQWEGKVGACRVKHEDYNGSSSAKVQYLIGREKQDKMPPWQEPGGGSAPAAGVGVSIPDVPDDLPFA